MSIEKNVDLIFNNVSELQNMGELKLQEMLLNVISNINDDFIIKYFQMNGELLNLLGFESNEYAKEKLNYKPVSVLKSYIENIAHNIFEQLKNEHSFIYRNFYYGYDKKYKDLNLSFKHNVYEFEQNLEFTIVSLTKRNSPVNGGCGSGQSFTLILIDKKKLTEFKKEINELDIPKCIKEKYFTILDEEDSNMNYNVDYLFNYLKEVILNVINDYIDNIEDSLKVADSFRDLKLKEKINSELSHDDYIHDFINTIEIEYENDNKVIVKFLDKIIRKIEKTSYISYNISCIN